MGGGWNLQGPVRSEDEKVGNIEGREKDVLDGWRGTTTVTYPV